MGRLEVAASILLSVGSPCVVFGLDDPPPVVTVCEALKDVSQFDGKSLVVVGRYRPEFEGSWLDAECGFKAQNAGKEFETSISLSYLLSEGALPPPHKPNGFRWDGHLLRQKVDQLRPAAKHPVLKDGADEWVAIFGRLETHLPRRIRANDRDVLGFGHMSSSPAQLVWRRDSLRHLK